ncbi:ArsR family transcriptional regulator [Halopenitus sp. H-Gu1]|uniref:ArsR family transcriptional regulator n=1 Tax=Halopenitus sp. H-Gu1 TaxID=3242697 RepID=UPI00359D8DAB
MDELMPKDRDEETGKYTERYPAKDFLSAIDSLNGAAGTQEIADDVGCAYRTAYAKLTELEEGGKITSRKVGNAKLWQLKSSEES